jgi:hypothetical protein
MKKYLTLAAVLGALIPSLAFAQAFHGTMGLLESIGYLVDMVTVLVVGLALIGFFYGLMRFIFAGANGKIEGKSFMVWGVVALFVMMSVWGLVRFLQDEFLPGGDFNTAPTIPSF